MCLLCALYHRALHPSTSTLLTCVFVYVYQSRILFVPSVCHSHSHSITAYTRSTEKNKKNKNVRAPTRCHTATHTTHTRTDRQTRPANKQEDHKNMSRHASTKHAQRDAQTIGEQARGKRQDVYKMQQHARGLPYWSASALFLHTQWTAKQARKRHEWTK